MRLPVLLRILWNAWIAFSHVLGIVMSTIILTLLWIFGFGLYAIISKTLALPLFFKKRAGTYWIDANPTPTEEMRYPF